jgi:hypothetical protein
MNKKRTGWIDTMRIHHGNHQKYKIEKKRMGLEWGKCDPTICAKCQCKISHENSHLFTTKENESFFVCDKCYKIIQSWK